ncbi:MAG: chlorophyll A-B binding protein [Cyanobacteria bacterium J06600_6]
MIDTPESSTPAFEFNRFAELWNGRLAMINFMASTTMKTMTNRETVRQWEVM